MTVVPLDLVAAHPWQRIAFTTYAVSLSFFEAVVLDAVVRGGGSQPLILADVEGVRASLSEQGAQRVGKEYEVEPISVSGGVFHPKVSVFVAGDECHVLAGSGNLTFGGWGGSCEVIEHLHPTFAAAAIADAAEFFEMLSSTPRIRHGASGHCAAIAGDLRRAGRGRTADGDFRLLHNLRTGIAQQLVELADDLGGAQQVIAVAPFWDNGAAIDSLCAALGLDEVLVHAHEHGAVHGVAGANWPRGARTRVRAVRATFFEEERPRRLHAKCFEILCRRGRVLASGSANGTAAALEPGRNVEVCVARIQRDRKTGWAFEAAVPPLPRGDGEQEEDPEEASTGVLRATLENDVLTGEILTPRISGAASLYRLSTVGPQLLAETTVAPDGTFRLIAPRLERWAWQGERLVIRVRHSAGRDAEGFVSVASYADIARRAGLIGKRLFAMLTGTETPADVAAIMSWFHENPQRLDTKPRALSGHSGSANRESLGELISVASLRVQHDAMSSSAIADDAETSQGWTRFMAEIMAAFREKRGRFDRGTAPRKDGEGEENDEADTESSEPDPASENALASFEQLFELLTVKDASRGNAQVAFDLSQYICERLRPDAASAKRWLDTTVRLSLRVGVAPGRRDELAAGVLTLLGASPDRSMCRWARGALLTFGVDLDEDPPSPALAFGFQAALPQTATFPQLWMQVRAERTYREQIRAYLDAFGKGVPAAGYPDLPSAAPNEWRVLEAAITSSKARRTLAIVTGSATVCPECDIALPPGERVRLESIGIATAKNCCRRILIRVPEA